MTNYSVVLRYKHIAVVKRRKVLGIPIGWEVPEEKIEWNNAEHELLDMVEVLKKIDRLPVNFEEVRQAIIYSITNAMDAYCTRGAIDSIRVVDVHFIVKQLRKYIPH